MTERRCPRCGQTLRTVWLILPDGSDGDHRFRPGRITEWVCHESCGFREKVGWPTPPRPLRIPEQRPRSS